MHGTPVLTIVMNNGGYGAVDRATRAMYPQGRAVTQGMSLVSLEPMPRFEDVVKACGGWGARVERFEDGGGCAGSGHPPGAGRRPASAGQRHVRLTRRSNDRAGAALRL